MIFLSRSFSTLLHTTPFLCRMYDVKLKNLPWYDSRTSSGLESEALLDLQVTRCSIAAETWIYCLKFVLMVTSLTQRLFCKRAELMKHYVVTLFTSDQPSSVRASFTSAFRFAVIVEDTSQTESMPLVFEKLGKFLGLLFTLVALYREKL